MSNLDDPRHDGVKPTSAQNGGSACALTPMTHHGARPPRRLASEGLSVRVAARTPRVAAASAARQRYAGVMIRPSSDGRRLTAHLEPGGPCIALAEPPPHGPWPPPRPA